MASAVEEPLPLRRPCEAPTQTLDLWATAGKPRFFRRFDLGSGVEPMNASTASLRSPARLGPLSRLPISVT